MASNFNPEPLGTAPDDLVQRLYQVEVALVFCYICLQKIVKGDIVPTQDGKKFLQDGMRGIFQQADSLFVDYTNDYYDSLHNLAWEVMRVEIVARTTPDNFENILQATHDALQMLLVI